jgi:DNA-binding HxlR family transcriptional regulator
MWTAHPTRPCSFGRLVLVLDVVGGLVVLEILWWLLVIVAIKQFRALRKEIESLPVEYL